jgi:hypothetical protein
MTTKLDEMWAALAAYQPHADAAGHGKSWARMCANKTSADAAAAATDAADAAAHAYAYAAATDAADDAAAAYAAAAAAADVVYWAQKAIDLIKKITTSPAAQRPWLDLTDKQIKAIDEMALTKNMAIVMTMKTLKEKNT